MKRLLVALVFGLLSVPMAVAGGRTDWEQDGLKGQVRSVTAAYFAQGSDSNRWTESRNREVSTYDLQGAKTETATYSPNDGSLYVKTVYAYNAKWRGQRAETTIYTSDGSPQSKWAYIYDAQGNIVEVEHYGPDGSLRPRAPEGPARETMPMIADHFESKTYTYYDTQRNRITEEYFYTNDSLTTKLVNTHDAEGKETERAAYNADSSLTNKFVYTYEYDSIGNWIKQTKSLCVPQGESGQLTCQPHLVIYRTITYYGEGSR